MSNVSRRCCLSDRCGGWCRTLLCHSVRIALPDEVFVGLNTLVGLAYLSGYERIVVPMAAMIFCVAFFASTVGAIMTFASYKKMSPRVYKARELIIHGISAACFVMAIIYLIEISLHSSSSISSKGRGYDVGTRIRILFWTIYDDVIFVPEE